LSPPALRGSDQWRLRIVIPSSSCAITIAQDYARMLAEEPAWMERARKLADRITAFTPFVARLARERKVWGRKLGLRATYHDACQSANVLGIGKAPRALLREVAGVEIVEMAESSVCCGFGGSFRFEFTEVANRVLERKLANIEATGVDCVIADNPGCLTHAGRSTRAARRPECVIWPRCSGSRSPSAGSRASLSLFSSPASGRSSSWSARGRRLLGSRQERTGGQGSTQQTAVSEELAPAYS
jgi:Fe-S oxidoreductase